VQGWHVLAIASLPIKAEEPFRQGKEQNAKMTAKTTGWISPRVTMRIISKKAMKYPPATHPKT